MPRLSPRLMKFVLLPGSILVTLLAVGLKSSPQKDLRKIPLTGYEESDPRHTEEIRLMAMRAQALEELMHQLADGDVSLREATDRFVELNSHSRGFQVYCETRSQDQSTERNTCVMLLCRLRTFLLDDPEKLHQAAERLRSEFVAEYGVIRPDESNHPLI